MGISFSQQISSNITNGYMQVINQLTASITSTATQNLSTVNRLFITVCGVKNCGPGPCTVKNFSSNQQNQVTAQLSSITLQSVVNQVKNRIEDVTSQYIMSLNQTEQAWLAFAFNINSQNQQSISNFSQKISNLISDKVTSVCQSSIFESNDATIIFCGDLGDISLGQSNTILAAQSCISKQIVNNIISNTELYNGMQYADAQNYSDQSGPFSFLYYIGLFIMFIILVVTIAGIIRYATRGPKQRVPAAPIIPATSPRMIAPVS